jgi:hypothetical protein
MVGLAYAAHGILGTSTVVEGLQCTPTTPTADLNIHVNVGSIYSMDPTDASAYGDLGIDTNSIMKQGINALPKTLAITPPSTAGFSQVFLVQAILNDVDAGAMTLSYWNASNPAAPYSGPAGNGMSQFTTRTCVCTIALKAGVAAATGSQTTPAPDLGFVGLYAVTVVNGQTQITSGNIVQLPTAPFFPTLPAVPPDVQNNLWTYNVDTSAGGAPVVTTATTTTASAVLTFAGGVPAYVAAGQKAFDITTVGAITGGQTVLSKTGTTVTLTAVVNATVAIGDQIAFSTNGIVASIFPPPAALVPGLGCEIKLAGTNTGPTTLNLNGLGAVAIHRATGAAVAAGDLPSGMVCYFVYDGSFWQVSNFQGTGGGGATSFSTVNIPYCVDTSVVANTVTAPFTPAITSLFAGLMVEVKIANGNTGPVTIAVNALGAVAITDSRLQPLAYGALTVGQVALLIYDGTQFQLVARAATGLQANTTFFVSNNTSGGILGSDTLYDGTSATISGTHGPWLTLQGAANNISKLNINGFSVTVNVANGTYAAMSITYPFSGNVIFVGNPGSPTSCVVTGAVAPYGNACFEAVGNGVAFTVNGFQLSDPTLTGGTGLTVSVGGQISYNNINFAACYAHILCAGGLIFCLGNYTISGGANYHIIVQTAGQFAMPITGSTTVSLLSVPNFIGSFALVRDFGILTSGANVVFSGAATGTRYTVSAGIIDTGGQGAAYLPGNLPGQPSNNGIYI